MQPFFIVLYYLYKDMKEIYITEEQYSKIEEFIKENSNKVPAAQDQVKNRVNAGIMDAVACGGMCEGAEPESTEYHIGMDGDSNLGYAHVNENKEDESQYKIAIDSILKYFKSECLNIYPYPEIEFNWEDQNGLFITTGYYLPNEKKVVLFCKDRHPKDILRSFTHELIHHMQNLEGKNMSFSNQDDVKDNKELEKLEAEAYLKGNIYFRKWTEYERQNNNSLLSESVNKIDESERWTIYAPMVDESMEPNEVDLSSFNIKKNLNPKFWKDEKLDSRIRMKLLDIADDFIEFLGVKWVKPKDIIITGSLANYNWNEKFSDIDLHVVLDYSKIDKRKDFVSNYFHALKKQWNEEHGDIKIFGFPIEVYVQDVDEVHTASGVYSLEKNKWVEEPERDKLAKVKVNKTNIKKVVSDYTKKIDDLLDLYKKEKSDNYKLEQIHKKAEKLFNEIKTNRRNSLDGKNTEITEPNIIFKTLRRLGYIEKLVEIITKCYNKLNSLP